MVSGPAIECSVLAWTAKRTSSMSGPPAAWALPACSEKTTASERMSEVYPVVREITLSPPLQVWLRDPFYARWANSMSILTTPSDAASTPMEARMSAMILASLGVFGTLPTFEDGPALDGPALAVVAALVEDMSGAAAQLRGGTWAAEEGSSRGPVSPPSCSATPSSSSSSSPVQLVQALHRLAWMTPRTAFLSEKHTFSRSS